MQPMRTLRGERNMWFVSITAVWLLVISIIDVRKRRVPVWTLAIGGILVLIKCICRNGEYLDVISGMLPGVFLLLTAFVSQKAGYGDGVALLILGMISGAGKSLMIFGFSLFLAAVFSVVMLVLGKAGRNTAIPFLPFLAAAWLAVMI